LAVQNLNETLGIAAGSADDSTLTPSWRWSR
jgi:hypothetical protein